MRKLGAGRGIVADRDGVVICGNKSLEVAAQLGIPVQIVETDGKTLVVTKRTDIALDDPEDATARHLAYADNVVAREDLSFDPARVAEDLLAGLDLKLWFDKDELAKFTRGLGDGSGGGGEDPPDPEDGPTRVHLGEVWACGDHRLICGDCTEADVVRRLMGGKRCDVMLTDPPYAVDYVAKARDMNARGYVHSRATMRADIEGDGLDEASAEKLWADAFTVAQAEAFGEATAIYAWHDPRRAMRTFLNVLHELGWLHHQSIIWDKGHFVIGRCDYQARHEACWYGWVKGKRPEFYGEKNQTTVWALPRDSQGQNHPTQKPVALFVPSILNHTKSDGIVYDPFLGSGTTMIAAERTTRICVGCEVSEQYCDVILKRWEAETGGTAELLEEAPGAQAQPAPQA